MQDRKSFRLRYLQPALAAGLIEMSLPDKPNSRLQRYRLTDQGRLALQTEGGWNGPMNDIQIVESDERQVEVQLHGETVWLSQAQMAALFDVQKAAISKHLKNIFASGELEPAATVSKMETVQTEGTRTKSRQVEHYNLDAIISVGYRVNSAAGHCGVRA